MIMNKTGKEFLIKLEALMREYEAEIDVGPEYSGFEIDIGGTGAGIPHCNIEFGSCVDANKVLQLIDLYDRSVEEYR